MYSIEYKSIAMKKERFSSKFIHDTFRGKNTITRKSDGHKWTINICFWNLTDNTGFKMLNDESLEQFFDDNNNFRSDLYELTYVDHFKDFCRQELKANGKKWLEDMPDGEAKENILKRLIG